MRLTGFDRGRATYEMTVTDNLTNAVGVLLGGIARVLAHATMAAGSMTILDDDQIKTRTGVRQRDCAPDSEHRIWMLNWTNDLRDTS